MTTMIDMKTRRRSVIVDKIAEDTKFYPATDTLKILKLFVIWFFHIDVVLMGVVPGEQPSVYLVPLKTHKYLGNQPLGFFRFWWVLLFRRQAIEGAPSRSARFYLNTLAARHGAKIRVVRTMPANIVKNS